MKRAIALLLAVLCAAAFCACGRSGSGEAVPSPTPVPSAAPTPEPTTTPEPTAVPKEAPTAEPAPSPEPEPAPAAESAAESEAPGDEPSLLAVLSDPTQLPLPDSSSEYSLPLAIAALTLCTGHGQDAERRLLEGAGFTVLKQVNFDKPDTDTGHTCAWSLGKKTVTLAGQTRTLLITAIRGTNAGEWISNFDFVPSREEDTLYAENFLACARDVLAGLEEPMAEEEDPLLLICGHSRGAACANLLGLLLDESQGPEGVYVYTFATPGTARGEALEADCPNVFNLLNPCDLVTLVPPASLGFGRVGQDVLLSNTLSEVQAANAAADTLSALAPSITDYYNVRHALNGPGLSDSGLTAFEFLCAVSGALGSGSGDLSLLSALSSDSDFAPVAAMLAGEGAESRTYAAAMQHMPATYLALLLASSVFG